MYKGVNSIPEETVEGEPYLAQFIDNFEYEDDRYSDALKKAVKLFSLNFCKIDDKNKYGQCLSRYEHDGDNVSGVEFAVGLYSIGGDTVSDPIEIGIITDGYTAGYFLGYEDYKRGLIDSRIFLDECRILETIEGERSACWHGKEENGEFIGGYEIEEE